MTPIGRVGSPRTEPLDDDWDSVRATVTLDADLFTPDALDGLDGFSHVEVVYVFDRVDPATVQTGARHPRNNPEYLAEFAPRGEVRQPAWPHELMSGYWRTAPR